VEDPAKTAELAAYSSPVIDAPAAAVEAAAKSGRTAPRRRRRAVVLRRVLLAVVFAVELALLVKLGRLLAIWDATVTFWIEMSLVAGSSITWVLVGAVLCDRQPRNRCGRLMMAGGVAIVSSALTLLMLYRGWDHAQALIVVAGGLITAFSVLLVWLLLAWPTGRLSRRLAWFVACYGVTSIGFVLVTASTIDPSSSTDDTSLLTKMSVIVDMFVVFGGLVASLVLLVRRLHLLPPKARRLARPVVAAAAVAVAVDFVFRVANDLVPDTREREVIELALNGPYFVGMAVVAVLFALAAWRRGGAPHSAATVDLGQAIISQPVAAVVTETLGDPSARVLFPTVDGWVDAEGVAAGSAPAGRVRTVIERDDVVIAGIEHDEKVGERPAVLEAAAGSLALLVDHDALEAQTRFRLRELAELRLAILDAEDTARRLLERDLHDGAQQQLLALALEARSGPTDPAAWRERAGEILAARDELLRVAGGLTERVVAERGLDVSLRTLVATASVPIATSVAMPDEVPANIAAGAWFVASEGLANATKHAHAERVALEVRPSGDQLVVAVTDDGCGLADVAGSGLRGLARRVAALGGDLVVSSVPGSGTSLVASLPLGGVG
jgi:signal transduction histidine kinase